MSVERDVQRTQERFGLLDRGVVGGVLDLILAITVAIDSLTTRD